MWRLVRASSSDRPVKARRMPRARRRSRCTKACLVDRELISLRTELTRRSGWSAAGIQ